MNETLEFYRAVAATGAFGKRSIYTILVQILSIALDSNRDLPRHREVFT